MEIWLDAKPHLIQKGKNIEHRNNVGQHLSNLNPLVPTDSFQEFQRLYPEASFAMRSKDGDLGCIRGQMTLTLGCNPLIH